MMKLSSILILIIVVAFVATVNAERPTQLRGPVLVRSILRCGRRALKILCAQPSYHLVTTAAPPVQYLSYAHYRLKILMDLLLKLGAVRAHLVQTGQVDPRALHIVAAAIRHLHQSLRRIMVEKANSMEG